MCSSVLGAATGLAERADSLSKKTIAAPETAVPVSAVGNVAAVQGILGDTRLFFQNADSSIEQFSISGPFTSGHFQSSGLLVPSQEVLLGTPISAVTVNTTDLDEVNTPVLI